MSNEDGGEKDIKKTLNVIQCLIRAGANINAADYAGNTPFHDAIEWDCYWRSVQINLKSILKAGGVATKSNHRGQTALHMAAALKSDSQYHISNGFPSRLDFLLQQDLAIDLHARDDEGIMAIHLAASTSDINTWQLTRAGADLQAQTLDGRTPLHFAAKAAQSNVVGLLCQLYREESWAIDQKDANSRTPLHEAACSGNSECVYFLLQSGADPNVKDKQGQTPLHAAAEHHGDTGKLRQLRKYEKLPYWEDPPRGKRRLAAYLDVKRGVSNAQSRLSLAIGQEEEARIIQDVVRLLLSAGADPAAFDKFEHTAYDVAVMLGSEAVVDVLLPRRQEVPSETKAASLNPLADRWCSTRTIHAQDIVKSINTDDIKLHTLLETAICLKNEAVVEAVLRAGADPTTITADGLTAMHTVAHWGLTSMMKIMSSYVVDMNTFSPPLLHAAARRELSNIQMVDLLIKLGVNVDALYQEKATKYHNSGSPIPSYTTMHIFAAGELWWHVSALQSLCGAGADMELTDGDGKTALQCALSGNRSGYCGTGFWRDQTLEVLLTQGANINALSPDNGSTPLIAALESKRGAKLIQKLLDRGANISLGKLPALFAAIESEDPEATAAILEAGADFNAIYRPEYAKRYNSGPKSETPLLAAARKDGNMAVGTDIANSRASIMTLLLQHGSNPVMELNHGETTVLHEIAYFSGLLGPILKAGVDLEINDRQGRTPLLVACSPIDASYLTVEGEYAAQELIRAGANIHATDNAGSTPLHLAAASGLGQTTSLLISHGASVSATNNAGLTPLYYALSYPNYIKKFQTIRTLLSAGADPLVTGSNGETALHLLAPSLIYLSPADGPDARELRYQTRDQTDYFAEFIQLYQRFVEAGCDRNARDNFGNTPLFPYVAEVKPRNEILGTVPPAGRDIKRMFEQHDVFAVNDEGDTLLHVAAGRKGDDKGYRYYRERPSDRVSVTLFRELMERGLDPRRENKRGLSALDVAAACGKEGVLGLFGRED
jgi:ankyrin repeat protein